MEFKNLQNVPVEMLYRAFTDAFSNYAVNMKISLLQFTEMITSRSFTPENSMGCFIHNELAGFILCGIRVYNKKKIGYDIATGVLNEYQNKGIGKEMLSKLINVLKNNSVDCFRLEVLENNTAAISLYKNQGFDIVRKLECYEADKDALIFSERVKYHFNSDLSKLARLKTSDYQLFKPTWQNDLVTVGNLLDKHSYQAIEKNGTIVCFGFINSENGRIPQIGILPDWRNQGLEAMLISKLVSETKSEKVAFINVEAASYLSETLDNIGITTTVGQFEMELDLQNESN
jgi:ribosomal protein S18 acetylase RimI-like enzyme